MRAQLCYIQKGRAQPYNIRGLRTHSISIVWGTYHSEVRVCGQPFNIRGLRTHQHSECQEPTIQDSWYAGLTIKYPGSKELYHSKSRVRGPSHSISGIEDTYSVSDIWGLSHHTFGVWGPYHLIFGLWVTCHSILGVWGSKYATELHVSKWCRWYKGKYSVSGYEGQVFNI